MVDRLKVELCVESLCQNGCAAVNATITAMQKDLDNISLPGLQMDDKKMVLKELQDIMSVYDGPCEIKQQAVR
jgi:hypothetical protein